MCTKHTRVVQCDYFNSTVKTSPHLLKAQKFQANHCQALFDTNFVQETKMKALRQEFNRKAEFFPLGRCK